MVGPTIVHLARAGLDPGLSFAHLLRAIDANVKMV
eukprot:COSAG02_NODE_1378_length_12990_cov_3.643705_12_plen_35_part_00